MMQSIEVLTISEKTAYTEDVREKWAKRRKIMLWSVRVVIISELILEGTIISMRCVKSEGNELF